VSVGYADGSADLGTQPAKAYVPTNSATAESKDSGGCQFAPGGTQSGLGTLFGLGALALGFGRRRRGATR
jgi:MYXO-CTERM domain-containing protein